METVALQYNICKNQPKKILNNFRPISLPTHKKSGLEEALEDVANGRVTTIHIPKMSFGNAISNQIGYYYGSKKTKNCY